MAYGSTISANPSVAQTHATSQRVVIGAALVVVATVVFAVTNTDLPLVEKELSVTMTEKTASTGVSTVEQAIVSPYPIVWDNNAGGSISDGGRDMYDGGNQISTSLCGSHLSPYTDNMAETSSSCFGPGGSYKMDIGTSAMAVVTHNSGSSNLDFKISGNLGADGGGMHSKEQFQSGSLRGYMTSVCAASDPSINHLFVIDSSMSPSVSHYVNPNTDSDIDEVRGIGPGSPIIYILYASQNGHCHSTAEHRAVFDAAVSAVSATLR